MTYQPSQGSYQPQDLYHLPGVPNEQPPGQPPFNGYPPPDPGIQQSPYHAQPPPRGGRHAPPRRRRRAGRVALIGGGTLMVLIAALAAAGSHKQNASVFRPATSRASAPVPALSSPASPVGSATSPVVRPSMKKSLVNAAQSPTLAHGRSSARGRGEAKHHARWRDLTRAGHDAAVAPASSAAPASPAAAAAPSPAVSLQAPATVKFIISGYAPGDGYGNGPDISYGSDSDTHEAKPADIDGMVTYSVPFSPNARYYSVTAQLAGSGHLSCKIVVIGPYPDQPLTVSSGKAPGGYPICSAQAAPTDSSGLSWQNEQ